MIKNKITKISLIIFLFFSISIGWSDVIHRINCDYDRWIDQLNYKKIVCSSALETEGNFSYRPLNLLDGNNNTSWCPTNIRRTNGIGEFIVMKIPFKSKGFELTNGVAMNNDLFHKNNRVKSLCWGIIVKKNKKYRKVFGSRGKCGKSKYALKIYYVTNLRDTKQKQKIIFSQYENFKWDDGFEQYATSYYLLVGINDIYKGTKYNDTCISRIDIIR